MTYCTILGGRFRELRLEAGMTIAAVAETSGVSISTISRFENGSTDPGLTAFSAICGAVGVSPAEVILMNGELDGLADCIRTAREAGLSPATASDHLRVYATILRDVRRSTPPSRSRRSEDDSEHGQTGSRRSGEDDGQSNGQVQELDKHRLRSKAR